MLTINTNQTKVFADASFKRFKQDAFNLLHESEPEWCKMHNQEQIHAYIDEISNFSIENEIRIERNVNQLMLLNIRYGIIDNSEPYLLYILKKSNFSENYRIDELQHTLRKGNWRRIISLETPLDEVVS